MVYIYTYIKNIYIIYLYKYSEDSKPVILHSIQYNNSNDNNNYSDNNHNHNKNSCFTVSFFYIYFCYFLVLFVYFRQVCQPMHA